MWLKRPRRSVSKSSEPRDRAVEDAHLPPASATPPFGDRPDDERAGCVAAPAGTPEPGARSTGGGPGAGRDGRRVPAAPLAAMSPEASGAPTSSSTVASLSAPVASASVAASVLSAPPAPWSDSAQRPPTARSSPASDGVIRPRTWTSRSRYSSSIVPRSRTRASSSPAAYEGHVDVLPERREQHRDLRPQRVHAVARQAGDEDRPGDRRAQRIGIPGGLEQIRLVEGDEARLVARPELVEDRLDGRPVLLEVRVRGVDDLEQDVGPIDLLERRPESVDQLVRQLVDEADRVGDDRRLAVAEPDLGARSGRAWRTACPRPARPRSRRAR